MNESRNAIKHLNLAMAKLDLKTKGINFGVRQDHSKTELLKKSSSRKEVEPK